MEKIWEFFENMDELVYVSDMDSYELIYMNKKARETYGISSPEELSGKKCHAVMQNSATPCTSCNNRELTPGYFKEWQYYDPIIDKHLVIKDSMITENGKRYRMEIALDSDALEWQGSMLRNYQNMEMLINEGLRIALRASTPDQSLQIALEYMGKALSGERTYIFEKNQKGSVDNTYEWAASGVSQTKNLLQNQSPEIYANWYREFTKGRNIEIEDVEQIREEDPLQYENLKKLNVHSLVAVPLYDDTRLIGFYGVGNPPEKFLDYALDMLQIMGHFIVSSLKRRNLVRQLEEMSYHDQLTQFGNRHAMNEYLSRLEQGVSLGVVFCDVTGLKRVNDTDGHKAGDQLILRACNSLKRIFSDYGLFRIGGDELLVLCRGISETTLSQKIERLRQDLYESSVVMAVGAVWEADGTAISMDSLLSKAEGLMYKDKSLYYRTSGIDRRH